MVFWSEVFVGDGGDRSSVAVWKRWDWLEMSVREWNWLSVAMGEGGISWECLWETVELV